MSQQQLRLPLETTLRLTIAHLEWEKALLQARLLEYERTALLQQAEAHYRQATADLLQPHQSFLPVALAACTFDPAQGCLLYEAPPEACPYTPG